MFQVYKIFINTAKQVLKNSGCYIITFLHSYSVYRLPSQLYNMYYDLFSTDQCDTY